jgi:hypothetical protein
MMRSILFAFASISALVLWLPGTARATMSCAGTSPVKCEVPVGDTSITIPADYAAGAATWYVYGPGGNGGRSLAFAGGGGGGGREPATAVVSRMPLGSGATIVSPSGVSQRSRR